MILHVPHVARILCNVELGIDRPMNEPPRNKLPDPADIQKFFENWWKTASAIVATLVSALGSIQIPSPVAYLIAVPITITGIAIAVILYRRDARRGEKDSALKEGLVNKPASQPPGGAFRGLRRLLRGEFLPGPQRRRDAAQLSRQIVHPDFKIAVVTGDSGAGKSSLLEGALVEALETAGHPVVMISNAAQIIPETSTKPATIDSVQPIIAKLRTEVSSRGSSERKPVVLILDQFEELLSRLHSEAQRDELGDALWNLIADGTPLVIGMRKEHLIDFKAIARRFAYKVAFNDTFVVENFDTKEAATVIRECAKLDGITPDEDLPELIAGDLTVDGRVRPVD